MILGTDGLEIHPIDPINQLLDQHTMKKKKCIEWIKL